LLPHSEGSKSAIIADKAKFAEQLIMMVEERSVIAQSSVTFQHRITNKRKMGMLRRSFRKFKTTRRMMDDYNL